jgi:hypothetical protein
MVRGKATGRQQSNLTDWFAKKHGLPLRTSPYKLYWCNISRIGFDDFFCGLLIEVAASDFGESAVPYSVAIRMYTWTQYQFIIHQPRPDKMAGRILGWLEDKNPDALNWNPGADLWYLIHHVWNNPYPVRHVTL